MLRSRFLWKLYAGYAFLILLATGLVGGLVAVRVESETLAEIDRRLQGEAMLLRDIAVTAIDEETDTGAVDTSSEPARNELQDRIRRLGQEAGTRFTIIGADGVVLADSEEAPQRMDNHGTRPEVLAARDQGIGLSSRFSATLRRQMRYLALPCRIDDELVGYARVSLPLTALGERLAQLRSVVLLAAGIASVVALLLGFLHARRITRPVLSMVEAVEALAANQYQSRVELDSQDELGTLARAFNSMGQELRATVATLDADRNKLTAILASMEEGVVAVDHTERIVHMNQVAGQLLEADPDTVLDRPLWEVVRLHELSAALGETLEHEQPVHRVLQLPASGGDRTLEVHSSPLETDDGRLVGAVIVLDDVTQLRRLERVRRDFFGNVSHELKTPVAAIHGLVETMIDDPEMETPQRQRFLGKVLDQSDRLANLVTDLLSLSRLESGGVPELLPLDVRHTIEDSVRTLRTTAESKGVDLETDLPAEPLTTEGEEETLRQAVGNLLDNAVKYTPEGGRVLVRARREIDNDGDRVVVTVTDTGIGIDTRHLERIFERFYRVDKARSRAVGGTGLGLAIVKHSVLAMAGDVSVESSPGKGTTFCIDLPHLDEGADTDLADTDLADTDEPSAPAA